MIRLHLAEAGILNSEYIVLDNNGRDILTYTWDGHWIGRLKEPIRVAGYCIINDSSSKKSEYVSQPALNHCIKFRERTRSFVDPRQIDEIVEDFNDDSIFYDGPLDGR